MARHNPDWLDRLDRIVGRYERSIKQGLTPRRVDGETEAQTEHYREAAARRQMRGTQVREILNRLEVPLMWFVPYCNFAQHVDRVCRNYEALTRQALVEAAIERWTAHGLEPEVLRAISAEVADEEPR